LIKNFVSSLLWYLNENKYFIGEIKMAKVPSSDISICDHCCKNVLDSEIDHLPREILANFLRKGEYYFICEYCLGHDDLEYWKEWIEQKRNNEDPQFSNSSEERKQRILLREQRNQKDWSWWKDINEDLKRRFLEAN